jgi:hypothetical protein
MKRFFMGIAALCALFIISGMVSAGQATEAAEGGDYFVTGTGLDGSAYTGGLELIRYGGDVYTLSWSFANPAYGVGILYGDVLSAAYGGTQCAISAYVIEEGGNLTGGWANFGHGMVNSETATVQEITDAGSSYTLSGSLSDGTTYQGTMSITYAGDVGQVEQLIGDQRYKGVAIIQGQVMAMTFGDENCGVVAYQVQQDSSLVGIWTMNNGATTTSTETATLIDIAGVHNVAGTNPDGSQYQGTVDVQANNQVHTFTYDINGESTATGIMRGNKVAVGFGGEQCSVAVYYVQPNGVLSGLWTYVGQNLVGTEFATRTTDVIYSEGSLVPDPAGSYTVAGYNPGDTSGNSYEGTMEIVAQGDVYRITWTFANNTTADGIGILVNNVLAIGYGGEGCGVNGYSIDTEAMSGVWGIYGSNELGTEALTRSS